MNILITGGAGFIGSNLALRLQNDGHAVTIVDNFSTGSLTLHTNLIDFKGTIVFEDVRNITRSTFNTTYDVVFHLAAVTDTLVNDYDLLDEHLTAFHNVLDIFHDKLIIWASSAAVYGKSNSINHLDSPKKPANIYGFSKLAMENIQNNSDNHIIGLRFFNVYGNNERHKRHMRSMVNKLLDNAKDGTKPQLFKYGNQKRDFVCCDDVVNAMVKCMDFVNINVNEIYNVGSGEATAFSYIIDLISKYHKIKKPKYIDNKFDFFQEYTCADISKTIKHLNWEPLVSLEDYIRKELQNNNQLDYDLPNLINEINQ